MNRLHPSSLEILADAHYRLDSLPGVNPVQSAEGSINEVWYEDENAPRKVGQAHAIAEAAESEADAQEAADLLEDVLRGTEYDPNDADSYHPINR